MRYSSSIVLVNLVKFGQWTSTLSAWFTFQRTTNIKRGFVLRFRYIIRIVSRFWFKVKFIIYGFEFDIHICLYFLSAFSFHFRFTLENCVIMYDKYTSPIDHRHGFLWIWYLISVVFNIFSVFYQCPKKWPNEMVCKIQDTHIFQNSLVMVHGIHQRKKVFSFHTFQIVSGEKLSEGQIEWAKIERCGREFSILVKTEIQRRQTNVH